MRVTVNERAAKVIEKFMDEFSNRKLAREGWTNVISELIAAAPRAQWCKQIERNTPPNVLLERAMKDPKLARKFSEFLLSNMPESAGDPEDVRRDATPSHSGSTI